MSEQQQQDQGWTKNGQQQEPEPKGDSTMSEFAPPKGAFPGTMDYAREVIVGTVIRQAVEHDINEMRFYLTCSVGELAQRVVLALDPQLTAKLRPAANVSPAHNED